MKTIIIDVRTPKEFNEGSYPGAINLPSNEFNVNKFEPYRDHHIALVCFSGNRANQIFTRLQLEGYTNTSLMQNQMSHIEEGIKKTSTIWTVDRQFRLVLGLLVGTFLIGHFIFNSTAIIIILLIIFIGLIYSAVTDNCYLKMMIAQLPWNKTKASNTSKAPYAIQNLKKAI